MSLSHIPSSESLELTSQELLVQFVLNQSCHVCVYMYVCIAVIYFIKRWFTDWEQNAPWLGLLPNSSRRYTVTILPICLFVL